MCFALGNNLVKSYDLVRTDLMNLLLPYPVSEGHESVVGGTVMSGRCNSLDLLSFVNLVNLIMRHLLDCSKRVLRSTSLPLGARHSLTETDTDIP